MRGIKADVGSRKAMIGALGDSREVWSLVLRGSRKTMFSRVWFTPEKEGVKGVAVVGRVRAVRYGWDAKDHCHPGIIEIGVCISGRQTLFSGNRQFCVMPGNLFVNRPTECHHLGALPKGAQHYVLQLRLAALGQGKSFLGLPVTITAKIRERLLSLPNCMHVNAKTTCDAFRRLIKALCSDRKNSYRIIEVQSRCLDLVHGLCSQNAPITPEWQIARVRRITDMMNDAPERRFTVEELRKASGMSMSAFKQTFSAVTGLPPLRYQLTRRLARAKLLLETTKASASAISDSLGFFSPQHFSAQFGKWFGVSPSAVRKERFLSKP